MIYIVYIFIAWSSIAEYFVSLELPAVSFVDEFLVLILLLDLLFKQKRNFSSKVQITQYIRIILLISLVSMIVNIATPFGAAQFLFSIFKPVIVFYWIIRNVKNDDLLLFSIKLLFFLSVLQIPFFLYGLLTNGLWYTGDAATGATITGDAHQVGIYMWLSIIFLVPYYLSTKKKKYLFFITVFFIVLLITSTKQITLILPFVIIFLIRKQLKINYVKLVFFSIIFVGVGYYLYVTAETFWLRSLGAEFSNEDYLSAIEGSEKIQGYYSAIYELPSELSVPILGAGPGQYGSFVAMNARTRLSQKYIMFYQDLIPFGKGGTLTYRSSGLIAIYGDIGIIGLIIFLSIYLSTIKISLLFADLSKTAHDKGVAFLTSASGILIVGESVLKNIFEGNWFLLNLFWVLSASIFVKLHSKD